MKKFLIFANTILFLALFSLSLVLGGMDSPKQLSFWDERLLDAVSTSRENLEGIKACLDQGANLNAKDKRGESALLKSLKYFKSHATQVFLLSHSNIDVNAGAYESYLQANTTMLPALHWVVLREYTSLWTSEHKKQILQLFSRRGANFEIKDSRGRTPVGTLLSGSTQDLGCLQTLVELGADPSCGLGRCSHESFGSKHFQIILRSTKIMLADIKLGLAHLKDKHECPVRDGSCPCGPQQKHLARNGRILNEYFKVMMYFGNIDLKNQTVWRASKIIPIPLELGKLIAYHAAVQQD